MLTLLQYACILLLAVGRIINILLPLTLGRLVGVLVKDDGTSFWPYLLFCACLRFFYASHKALLEVGQQSRTLQQIFIPGFLLDSLEACDTIFQSWYV